MSRGMTMSQNIQFVTEDCVNCGVAFALPAEFQLALIDNHRSFYCPNGHSQSYTGKTDAEKERERAARLERALANCDEDLRAERAAHTATKGQLTKAKNRADKGVCQHCQRSFANVQRHVAHMHPEAVQQS